MKNLTEQELKEKYLLSLKEETNAVAYFEAHKDEPGHIIEYASKRKDPEFWEAALNYIDERDLNNEVILSIGKKAITASADFWERYVRAVEALEDVDESEFWQFVLKKKNEALWSTYLKRPYITEMSPISRFELLAESFPRAVDKSPSDSTVAFKGFSSSLDYSESSFEDMLNDVRSVSHWSIVRAIMNTGDLTFDQKITIALSSNRLMSWAYMLETLDNQEDIKKLDQEFRSRFYRKGQALQTQTFSYISSELNKRLH